MSKATHTPGPWGFHCYDNAEPNYIRDIDGDWTAWAQTIAAGDTIVAEAQAWTISAGYPKVDNREEMLANARLIAAAPELLEALEKIEALASDWDSDGAIGPKSPLSWESVARLSMDYARTAIAKAKGGRDEA